MLMAKQTLQVCDSVKDLEKERISWIIQMGPKCHHKGPYKGETGRFDMDDTEVRCFVVSFEDEGKGHKSGNAALEAGKGKEMDSSLELLEGTSLAFIPMRQMLVF